MGQGETVLQATARYLEEAMTPNKNQHPPREQQGFPPVAVRVPFGNATHEFIQFTLSEKGFFCTGASGRIRLSDPHSVDPRAYRCAVNSWEDSFALLYGERVTALLAQAVREAREAILKECHRKTAVYEMPDCGHSAYSSGATDSLAHLIAFIEAASTEGGKGGE